MQKFLYLFVLCGLWATYLQFVQAGGETPSSPLRLGLGQFKTHKSRITLSGFSSGGTFAQMMQFSYSSLFRGVAVFSHNFYRCGPPNGVVDDYDRVCTKLFNLTAEQHYNPELVHQDIQQYMRNGQIENVANLRNRRLYVYAGLRSFLFTLEQSMGVLRVYERYIQNPKAIRTRVQDANLVLPTNNPLGVPCTAQANERSFIGNCGFSGAHEALNFLLDDEDQRRHQHGQAQVSVELKEPQPGQSIRLAPLRYFDQAEFSRGVPNANMDSLGLIYIPTSGCQLSKCLLHFYFHGCGVGRELNGTAHIVNSGYIELAELNNIIMVFPQALSSQPNNVIGCWDTFGVGGPLYATQDGPQIRVVKRILDRFIGGRDGEGGGGSGGIKGQGPGQLVGASHNHGSGSYGGKGNGHGHSGIRPGASGFGGTGWGGGSGAFSQASATSNRRGWVPLAPTPVRGRGQGSLVRFPA